MSTPTIASQPTSPNAPRQGKPALAFWLETASEVACEIAAIVGYHCVILDMEHGVIPVDAADRLIAHARRLGLSVYSRVEASERVPIQRALDSGADGVILPQIASLPHAREVTAYAKFPLLGSRGIGFSRTMAYAAAPSDFVAQQNRSTRCYAMIETPGALADAEAIAALPAVDGLFLGPSDLSLTLGRGLHKPSIENEESARHVARAARAAGKTWAMPAPTRDSFRFAWEEGAAYVTVSDDLSALRAGLEQGLGVAHGE
jgi:2-dehydro-3-deoxyglucarate aldolase/4-hydroxy-2-oxoheptanedioate aldolase